MPPKTANPQMTVSAAIWSAVLCMIFGANTAVIKISLAGLGKFTAAGLRFTIATTVIALWARFSGRRYDVTREQIGPLAVNCTLFVLQTALFYMGISRTLASRGALLINVVPFFVLIFAHLFLPDDRINLSKILGMILGFGGVCLVLFDPQAMGSGVRSGDFFILAGTMVWAASAVYTKAIIDRFTPLHMVIYPMLCAIPIFFTAGWLWDDRMIFYIDSDIVYAILYQSLLSASIGFMAWTTMLQRYGASTLHSFIFIMPIAGVFAGAWLLKEPITHHIVTAVVLVTIGIGLVNYKRRDIPPMLPPVRT